MPPDLAIKGTDSGSWRTKVPSRIDAASDATSAAEAEARWQDEVERLHYVGAPIFYPLAALGFLCAYFADAYWFPAIAGWFYLVRIALAGVAALAVVAVRSKRFRGEYVLAGFVTLIAIACAFSAGYCRTPTALNGGSTAFAVACFLWAPAFLPSRWLLPALTSAVSVAVYAVSTTRNSHLAWDQIVSNGGFVVGFFAIASPFLYSMRYRLLRSNCLLQVALEQTNQRIARQAAELETLASFDGLTGVYNRRVGLLVLGKLLSLAARAKTPLTVVYVDVDGLKRVNDAHGHAEGDLLIRDIARALQTSVRTADVVIRLGGDEFGLVLPSCSREQAQIVTCRIEEKLNAASVGRAYVLATSHGACTFPDDVAAVDATALLEHADAEMYATKSARKARG